MTHAAPLKEAVERCMRDDPRFKLWHDTMALGNEDTAMDYARRAVRLTKVVGLDPISYVAIYADDKDRFDDVTQSIANELVRRGKARSYIQCQFTGLNKWARWCRCKMGRDLYIGKPAVGLRREKRKQIPAKTKLRRVMAHLDARSRVMMSFRAFSGLRPGILGNKTATNGLRLRHLDGLTFKEGRVEAVESVLQVNVPEALSKNGKEFFSFLGPEGIEYLLAYLEMRVEGGERLTPESPVVVPLKFAEKSKSGFVQRDTLTEPISDAMRKAGLTDTPYIWRSYFKTQLLTAQSQTGLLGDFVEFWMGHNAGIKAVYSFYKELNDEAVMEIRAAYEEKALPYLETRERSGDSGKRSKELKRLMLDSFNVPAEALEDVDLDKMDPSELSELMQKHQDERLRSIAAEVVQTEPAAPAPATPAPAPAATAPRQMIVALAQLQAYIELGWRYVYEARVPEGQALIEGPGTIAGAAPAMEEPVAAV